MSAPLDFRYAGLSYVALNVTDLARSVTFYEQEVGLQLVGREDGEAVFRCSDTHHDVILCTAAEPGLKRVAFAMETAGDLDRASAHFAGLGIPINEVGGNELGHLQVERAFRLREPASGLEIEFLHGMAPAPDPFAGKVARIVRLGHVVVQVTDWPATYGFLTEQANFRSSDEVDGYIAFLRAWPNPLHHSFAVGRGPTNQLHHVNFMVSDIDDVGRAINRMKKAGAEIVFGPGRHEPSGSIFLYFLEPDAMTLEYSFGMEEFPEDGCRPPRELEPKPEVLDTWGSVPGPRAFKVGAIEGAHG